MSAVLPIIIIDYFSASRTLQCIDDFSREISGADLRFVVVDHSVDEKNYKALIAGRSYEERQICGYRVCADRTAAFIYAGSNGGFAKGNNIGFRIAAELYDFDYVLFSNNDILLKNLDMESMIVNMKNRPAAAVSGPKVTGLDGKAQSPHRYRNIFQRWWSLSLLYPFHRFFKLDVSGMLEDASSGYVYRVIGAFMLCDAHRFEQAGCFDEHTFLYAEELILSERLKKYSYKVFYDADTEIVHEGGATTKKSFSSDLVKSRKMLESELYYYEHYIGTKKYILLLTKAFFRFYSIKWKAVHSIKNKIR